MTTQRCPATIAAQAAGQINETTGGVVGAIETASTFERDQSYALRSGDTYRRDHNATVREAEGVITALEGARETRLFSSGLAAIATVMRAADGPVVVQSSTYFGTQSLLASMAAEGRMVLRADPMDQSHLAAMGAAERPALIFIETPSNPFLSVVDIAAVAGVARGCGALLAVDSTAATPIHTRPLELGADIVIHSATKALNGHSDVVAGAISVKDADLDLWQAIKTVRGREGAILSPFDAYLLTRGMRTLALRVTEASRSALHMAHWLEHHPAVTKVRYPGLASHPGHDVAARQMDGGFGSLLSFDVKGGGDEALAVVGRLNLIKRATSLGGVESLIEHRHSIEPASTGIPKNLLRLSVGIEAVEDLVADLSEALRIIA
ncbi:MAG: PLP-dependent aspartate aminotransferase family protein [Pseudomonadota bacterium]